MSRFDPALPLLDPSRDLAAQSGRRPREAPVVAAARAFAAVGRSVSASRLRNIGQPTGGYGRDWFPTHPWVAVLNPAAEPLLRHWAQTAVACLEIVVLAYPGDEELQDFLGLPAVLHRWVMAQDAPERLRVDLCRLDLLGGTLGGVRILEFNASSPGGVISTGMINRFWRGSGLGELLAEWQVPPAPFERPEWFADWLLEIGRLRGAEVDELDPIGLFCPAGSTPFELDQARAQLRRRGRTAAMLEPTDARAGDIRLGYLKYIPLEPGEVEDWSTFCARVTDGKLVIPNPLAVRWIAENKLCLAVLSDPRFRRLFSPDQATALDAVIPYSRKLGDGIGSRDALADRHRLVLKEPYSCRGESVVIGAETTADAWSDAVGGHAGWVVQERITADRVLTERGPYARDLVIPVRDGQVIGYSSRMSQRSLLNGSQGGRCCAVFAP